MKTLSNIEEMIIRAAFDATELAPGWLYAPVLEVPCKVDLSKVYEINREYTYGVYEKTNGKINNNAIAFMVYPDHDEWVLQRIHGCPFPNEWATKKGRPEGCTSVYLEFNEKLKHDRATFSSREALDYALENLTRNFWWDEATDQDYYWKGDEQIFLSFDRIEALCTWEHLD